MRNAFGWLPAFLLLTAAGMHYGDEAIASLTGWDLDWSYAVCQSIGQAFLWSAVAVSARPAVLMIPGIVTCSVGAADSLMRSACLVAQLVDPIELPQNANLCDARAGFAVSAWGLAAIAVCACLLAAWATAYRRKSGE